MAVAGAPDGRAADRSATGSPRTRILVVLVGLIVVIALYDPRFLSVDSVRNILQNSSTRLLVALGAGIVLISRGVDLSGGRMVGLAAVVSASMLQTEEYSRQFYPDLPALPLILPIAVAIAITTILGSINGIVIAKLRCAAVHRDPGHDGHRLRHDRDLLRPAAQPLPADLGSSRRPHQPRQRRPGARPPWRSTIIIAIAGTAAVVFWVLLEKTVFGKNVYAVGGNPQAAQVSGVNIARTLIAVYALAGAMYGIAGVLEGARTVARPVAMASCTSWTPSLPAWWVACPQPAASAGERHRRRRARVQRHQLRPDVHRHQPVLAADHQGRDHHRRRRLRHGQVRSDPLSVVPCARVGQRGAVWLRAAGR